MNGNKPNTNDINTNLLARRQCWRSTLIDMAYIANLIASLRGSSLAAPLITINSATAAPTNANNAPFAPTL
jgi:hypothetical protein